MIKIKRGLDLPIGGAPEQRIEAGNTARSVALIGFDYIGMKPTMEVAEGDTVQLGQLLFTDKKTPGVKYTSPGAGKIAAINRGEKRALQSVVIELEGEAQLRFDPIAAAELNTLSNAAVRERMIESGLWTALRTRPYSKVPLPAVEAAAVFVTAIDTNPLAADPAVVISARAQDFANGLAVLARIAPQLFCCIAEGANIDVGSTASVETFSGPHPAGLAGTHIHHLCPVSPARSVLTINYQDVIALGVLFTEGRIDTERVVALAGPSVEKPRLLKTRLGANIDELVAGEHTGGDNRILSGSVLNGRKARGPYAYLGRFHQQVTILPEGRQREFMHYLRAGVNKHSVTRTFFSALARRKVLPFTTSTNGSDRAMVPIGNYEKVMPLDILPTQLLRSLIVGDTAQAQALGCLELDEEDLALCTYVCSGKYEYGPILRDNLTRIEKEG
ncbi:MAG: Na(+)-translocating NADH-quinone reductase subunit A [Pseudomonadales bacterium]